MNWHVAFDLFYKKLTLKQKNDLNKVLDGMSFSCGADLLELELCGTLVGVVYVKKMYCYSNEPIEKLCYAANFYSICVYCASSEIAPWSNTEHFYPQCHDCCNKPKISNAKKNKTTSQ